MRICMNLSYNVWWCHLLHVSPLLCSKQQCISSQVILLPRICHVTESLTVCLRLWITDVLSNVHFPAEPDRFASLDLNTSSKAKSINFVFPVPAFLTFKVTAPIDLHIMNHQGPWVQLKHSLYCSTEERKTPTSWMSYEWVNSFLGELFL